MKSWRWFVAAGVFGGCLRSPSSIEDSARAEGMIETAGAEIFFRVVGTGHDTVVAVPGGPGRPMDYLGGAVLPLAGRATWILYDPRRTGRSSAAGGDSALGLAADVRDLEAVRAHFGLERFSLLGHGTGAAIAAHYAAGHPARVARLVLVSPYPLTQGFVWAWHLMERDTALFSRGALAYQDSRQPNRARAYCQRFWFWYFQPVFAPDDLSEAAAAEAVCSGPESALVDPSLYQLAWLKTSTGHDWRAALGTIAAPTLVVEGVRATPGQLFQVHAEQWAHAIPDARVVALRGAALLPWLSKPAQFQASVGGFLTGQWPPDAYRPQPATTDSVPPTPSTNP